ncbi:tetratricopeptide repeat protein [Rouxiella silvae]|uniref:Tetratricopeptide repeat protein n=1 Tax=Rouxiella silvae TaxID=1646373 RepID=A0AA40X124_9GAMM|nr:MULTISPECIES: tetratricopeptide repeat protein [Rouxiella]KAB7893273.1 tetratricopeptide repeat protein [Rouxiella sp. S1S-2]MBF6636474.1 tetratricopeptide repeat protein [Rouxiella silvae]
MLISNFTEVDDIMKNLQLLNHAIELRKQGRFEESRQQLFSIIGSEVYNGIIYLNIAWSYDNQGLESDALGYYTKALKEDLSKEDHFEAKFGLACTYRCLNFFEEAELLFESLISDYPERKEVIPYFALSLTSAGKKDYAVRILLELVVKNPPTEGIQAYQKNLLGYLKEL